MRCRITHRSPILDCMPLDQPLPEDLDLSTIGARCGARVDDMLMRYVEWREELAATTDAYHAWAVAAVGTRASRFAAYQAALDQEESAAWAYARAVGEVKRLLPPHGLVRIRTQSSCHSAVGG